ncbi:NPC intracellular cholesterol transporter 2 homolog a-like [Camponotus japonicus]
MNRSMSGVLALLCVLYCSAFCLAIHFDDCGSPLGKFTEISVSGCKESDSRCALVRGTNASITIKFIPNKDINQVDVRVYGVLLDIPVPFPLDNPNACTDSHDGLKCPLQKDQEYNYTTSLFVQKIYPSVNVDVKFELVDGNEEKIVCIEFPAKVK